MQAIAALRRLRMSAAEIAEILRMALSTVSAVLKRIGLGKLSRLAPLAPLEPPNRYASLTLVHYYSLRESDSETEEERRQAISICRALGHVQRHVTDLSVAERRALAVRGPGD